MNTTPHTQGKIKIIDELQTAHLSTDHLSTDQLTTYTLFLADNALILSQRNSEWCGHGPVLEQDIAITNISLDLLGQARNFYQYAATLAGNGATEDSLAYLRTEREFKNCLLTELDKGDWAVTTLRQFFFSACQYELYSRLQHSKDAQLAAIAVKSLKEVTYHLRWSSEWVIRLGDGTEESRSRMLQALHILWPYTGEMFTAATFEQYCAAAGTGVDPAALHPAWEAKVQEVFTEAGIEAEREKLNGTYMHLGGKNGIHTEAMGYILAEMQYLQRSYPGNEW